MAARVAGKKRQYVFYSRFSCARADIRLFSWEIAGVVVAWSLRALATLRCHRPLLFEETVARATAGAGVEAASPAPMGTEPPPES